LDVHFFRHVTKRGPFCGFQGSTYHCS